MASPTYPSVVSFFATPNHTVLYHARYNNTPPSNWTISWWIKYDNYGPDAFATVTPNGFLSDANTPGAVQANATAGAGAIAIVAYDQERWNLTPVNEWSANCASGIMTGAWSSSTSYTVNQVAQDSFDSNQYMTLVNNTNVQPHTNGTDWVRCVPDATTIETYAIAFANLAHSKGYQALFVPAADLWQPLVPATYATSYQGMLASNVFSVVAPYYEYIHLQTQGLQPYTATRNSNGETWQNVTLRLATQARAANASAVITAGLTTKNIDSAATLAAAQQMPTKINGFWYNKTTGDESEFASTMSAMPGSI